MRQCRILQVVAIVSILSSINLLFFHLAKNWNYSYIDVKKWNSSERNTLAKIYSLDQEISKEEMKLQLESVVERVIMTKLHQVSQNLAATHAMLHRGEAANRVQVSYHLLQEVIYKINPNLTTPATEEDVKLEKTDNKTADVCPEIYKGAKYGYPFFYEGFVETKCTNVKPLSEIVSILLNFVDYPKDNQVSVNSILEGIEKSYPKISVIVAKDDDLDLPEVNSISVRTIVYPKSISAGRIWNGLIKAAKTKFVLIGRDIAYFDWNSRLTRLIREVGYLNIIAAGGATRTPDGHWSLSCHQVAYKNYTIAYHPGYHISQHECIYCSHITGPFVSRTRDLLKILFDKFLPGDVVFEDFFIRLYKQNTLSAVCPDAMYYVTDRSKNLSKKETWIQIAQKWELNQIRLGSGEMHIFTEKDYKSVCHKEQGLAVAPKCLRELANAVKLFMKTCEDNNIVYEITDGSLLGAVKFNKVLPWEWDADLLVLANNFSDLQKVSTILSKAGYKLDPRDYVINDPLGNLQSYLTLKGSGWLIEIYSKQIMDSEILVNKSMSPTKVNFDGMWVNTPTNPALYARNRYGHEIFKHAEHWRKMSLENGWELYHPSKFITCPNAGEHNCLDQYIADGSLQFEELIP